MADLDSLQASETTKIVGSDATGVEQTPVQSTSAGALHTNLRNASGAEIGTTAAPVRVDPTGTTTQPVSAASLPLPSGASTASLQTSGNTSLASIDTKTPTLGQKTSVGSSPVTIASDQSAIPVTGTVSVSNFPATQNVAVTSIVEVEIKNDSGNALPISAASLPLPAGAATSALQTSGNASLSSIDTKTPVLGQALAASSVPVVLTAAQLATLTPLSTVAVTGPLTDSQLRASVVPVSLTSTTVTNTVAVSAAALPLPSGASTSALQTTGNASLASIDAGIPAALGATTIANSMPVTIASDQTVPVSAASLPLPIGAATSALQTTLNASLASIDSKIFPDIVNTSGLQATLVVGTTAVEVKVGASRLTNRVLVTIDNTSTAVLYWGYSNTTSTTNYAGRIFKDQQASWSVGPNVTIYIIAATAANSVHISEGA